MTIKKPAITVGDILDLVALGRVNSATVLVVATTWAPVPITAATTALVDSVSAPDDAREGPGGTLYLVSPVEQYVRAWDSAQHHGSLPRGQGLELSTQ